MIPTLKKGMSGDAVARLQKLINEWLARSPTTPWPVALLVVDGKFGKVTVKAVQAFQEANGLTPDAVVGPLTWAALEQRAPEPVEAEPPRVEHPAPAVIEVKEPAKPQGHSFVEGWYTGARKFPANPGRIGGEIEAKSAVVHTTDCLPGTMPGIVQRWTEKAGACAHFCLGRRAATLAELASEKWPSAGLVQMVPINRNGNHAGAGLLNGVPLPHGWYVDTKGGKQFHPNAVSVGIEIDCAGSLQKSHGVWIHRDTQRPMPDQTDVYIDERGKGWHTVTPYQFQVLGELLDALDATMPRFKTVDGIKPNGGYQANGVTWGAMPGVRFVGHVTLDPYRKNDPGPQVMAWLRERYGAK